MEFALAIIAFGIVFFVLGDGLHACIKTIVDGKVKIAEAKRDEARAKLESGTD